MGGQALPIRAGASQQSGGCRSQAHSRDGSALPSGSHPRGQRASSCSQTLASLLEALQGWGVEGGRCLGKQVDSPLRCPCCADHDGTAAHTLRPPGRAEHGRSPGGSVQAGRAPSPHFLSGPISGSEPSLGGESPLTAPAALPAPDLTCTLPGLSPSAWAHAGSQAHCPAGHVASVRKASVEQSSHPGTHHHHPPTQRCFKAKPCDTCCGSARRCLSAGHRSGGLRTGQSGTVGLCSPAGPATPQAPVLHG